jgi:hypothetical protein
MTDANAMVVALLLAAAAVVGVFVTEHERPACVRIASVIEIAGDCGRK